MSRELKTLLKNKICKKHAFVVKNVDSKNSSEVANVLASLNLQAVPRL